jgi:hypothetical protein
MANEIWNLGSNSDFPESMISELGNARGVRLFGDFGFEFPAAETMAPRTTPERVAFVEDQLFGAAIVRI